MYNRMRRIFVALGVALPLIAVVPASHAQVLNDWGLVACYTAQATGLPILPFKLLVVNPPSVREGSTNGLRLGWAARVRTYDDSGSNQVLQDAQSNKFIYSPGQFGTSLWTDTVYAGFGAAYFFVTPNVRWVWVDLWLWYWDLWPRSGTF